MSSSPENHTPLSPTEVNAILGLDDGAPADTVPPPPLFRPKRAGEPQFELESRRDTALANALYSEARRMKALLDAAPLGPRQRREAEVAHEYFVRALLDFLRYAGTSE